MKLKIFFKYWLRIMGGAWQEVSDVLGVRGIIIDFIISATSSYFYKGNNYDWGSIFFGILVFVGLALITWFCFIPFEAARQDNQLRTKLDYYKIDYLPIGIGEENDFEDGVLLLEFGNNSEVDEIHDMYVMIDNVQVAKVSEEIMGSKGDFAPLQRWPGFRKYLTEISHIGKKLKWRLKDFSLIEQITLRPQEAAKVEFLTKNFRKDVLHFGFDVAGYSDEDKNDWGIEGVYKIWLSVFGKVGGEASYRKMEFILFMEFRKSSGIMVYQTFSSRWMRQFGKSPDV